LRFSKGNLYIKGFLVKSKNNMVCKLKKSLYSLKHYPHGWNHKIMHIFSQEFEGIFVDHIVYFKRVQKNSHVIIILDVDDLILAFNDLTLLKKKKDNLLKKFEIVDLGEIQYFLGLKLNHVL